MYGLEPRPGFTKATVCSWRVSLEARGLGTVSINVRITAVRKLAVEAADNGLLAPELANGIARVKGVASKGIRLGNWLSVQQAQKLLNAPDATTTKGLRDLAILAVLVPEVRQIVRVRQRLYLVEGIVDPPRPQD